MHILFIEKILWVALGIYWLIAAFFVKRTVKQQSDWQRVFYLFLVTIAFILLFTKDFNFSFLYAHIFPQNDFWKITGLGLCIAGLSFCVCARVHLGENWSGTITIKEDHELVQNGPYAITRNPIYTGLLFGFLGCSMSEGLLKGYLGIPLVVAGLLMKIAKEELFMTEAFGEKFLHYKMKVKRLMPFIY
jgi:protein-S-isoprenylcysteine O-methyltransferase Ste14